MEFYPEFENLFVEVKKGGRRLDYEPEEICQKFEEYIAKLSANPMQVEVTYKKQSRSKAHDAVTRDEHQGQTRTERFPYPPTISDFVVRFLGKKLRWWSELDKTKNPETRELYIDVKEKITQYCRRVKLAGAEVGVYNYNIIARELGLVDKQQVEHTGNSIRYIVGSAEDADELKKAANGVGLAK